MYGFVKKSQFESVTLENLTCAVYRETAPCLMNFVLEKFVLLNRFAFSF